MKVISDKNKEERDRNKVPTVRADVTVAHNYSSQSLNSTELAKEKLRQMLAEVGRQLQWNIFILNEEEKNCKIARKLFFSTKITVQGFLKLC